eukprot:1012150-Pelagomonas_calceolata.AAC.5
MVRKGPVNQESRLTEKEGTLIEATLILKKRGDSMQQRLSTCWSNKVLPIIGYLLSSTRGKLFHRQQHCKFACGPRSPRLSLQGPQQTTGCTQPLTSTDACGVAM